MKTSRNMRASGLLGSVLSLLLFVVNASASTIEFDLSKTGSEALYSNSSPLVVMDTTNTYALTFQAYVDWSWWTDPQVAQNIEGVGVKTGCLDSSNTEGCGGILHGQETLGFSLGTDTLYLSAITFSNVEDNVHFDLTADGVVKESGRTVPDGTGPLDTSTVTFTYPGYLGASFLLAGTDGRGCLDNQFMVTKLEFNTVPEPATLFLLGSGLLGVFIRRRKVS